MGSTGLGPMEGSEMDRNAVTLRMEPEEIQKLDEYLADHPELGTRSKFIRDLISAHIDRDAGVGPNQNECVVVFKDNEIKALNDMIGLSFYRDVPDFIRDLVRQVMQPMASVGKVAAQSFEVANLESMKR